jgi:hypothetical protein
VLVAFPPAGRAQPPADRPEMVIRLSVQPMAAPKPALRYLLLPELREMQPGNPIPNYLKCMMDQDFTAPQEVLSPSALRQADWAARLDKPDWQILQKLKVEGIGLLIPDVQKLRSLANALQGRFHEEVAQRRFDDAIVTAKTMFAMSRHMAEHPTLIGDLVGIAIAYVAIGPLEEMLEQPGCPNLYWALTALPNPMISLAGGIEGERVMIGSEFHELSDTAPMTADQINTLARHIDKVREFDKSFKLTTRAWLEARAKLKNVVRAARARLVESGLPEELLLRFPAAQVILLDEKREYEVRRDEIMKLMSLPAWQFSALHAQVRRPKEFNLFEFLLPAVHKVRQAQGRLEQRIAMLRHVEALRLYAAAHDGKLPTTLSKINVPLPVDPFTGKPFRYALDGATAHLRGTPPPGQETVAGYNIHYEITIQK